MKRVTFPGLFVLLAFVLLCEAGYGKTKISSWEELQNMVPDGNYRLIRSLNEEDECYSDYNSGRGWRPIGTEGAPFTGTFDGQGFEISGLVIHMPETEYSGLFGHIGRGAEIKNTGLTNVDIKGGRYVGGLAGVNSGTVRNSYIKGSIKGELFVGGLTGWNTFNGTVINSYSEGNVEGDMFTGGLIGWSESSGNVSDSYSTGRVNGKMLAGGLIGVNHGGTVKSSYSTADVTGESIIGGLIGWNTRNGTVTNSHASGKVSGNKLTGGLIGWSSAGGTAADSHYSGSVSKNY